MESDGNCSQTIAGTKQDEAWKEKTVTKKEVPSKVSVKTVLSFAWSYGTWLKLALSQS